MQIRLEEVIEAIDKTDVNTQYYYYIPEERIILKDDDSIREKDLLPLPSHKEIDDYGTMQRFIDDLGDIEAKGWLEESIKGSGAFRRFRMTLERFGLTEQWQDYLYYAHEDLAMEWCEYYGVEYLSQDNVFANKDEEKPAEIKQSRPVKDEYHINIINEDNLYGLVYLVIDFRKTLSKLKGQKSDYDVDDALEELRYYCSRNYPIYSISLRGKNVGYAVCRVDDDLVWLESLYVIPEKRKQGVGSILLSKCEELVKEYKGETLYLYVHPNNDGMFAFLRKNGYDVLNLIEVRKAYDGESPDKEYVIGNNKFRY